MAKTTNKPPHSSGGTIPNRPPRTNPKGTNPGGTVKPTVPGYSDPSGKSRPTPKSISAPTIHYSGNTVASVPAAAHAPIASKQRKLASLVKANPYVLAGTGAAVITGYGAVRYAKSNEGVPADLGQPTLKQEAEQAAGIVPLKQLEDVVPKYAKARISDLKKLAANTSHLASLVALIRFVAHARPEDIISDCDTNFANEIAIADMMSVLSWHDGLVKVNGQIMPGPTSREAALLNSTSGTGSTIDDQPSQKTSSHGKTTVPKKKKDQSHNLDWTVPDDQLDDEDDAWPVSALDEEEDADEDDFEPSDEDMEIDIDLPEDTRPEEPARPSYVSWSTHPNTIFSTVKAFGLTDNPTAQRWHQDLLFKHGYEIAEPDFPAGIALANLSPQVIPVDGTDVYQILCSLMYTMIADNAANYRASGMPTTMQQLLDFSGSRISGAWIMREFYNKMDNDIFDGSPIKNEGGSDYALKRFKEWTQIDFTPALLHEHWKKFVQGSDVADKVIDLKALHRPDILATEMKAIGLVVKGGA